MDRVVYLNGKYVDANEAKVSIFDRGFLLSDGIYEVVPVINGIMIDKQPFLKRLDNSLNKMQLAWPMPTDEYMSMLEQLIEKNSLQNGGIYTQITRGVAPRSFGFPKDLEPTCMAFVFEKDIIGSPEATTGVRVATVEDIRWKRRDIKSIALLGQCIAKEQALKAGAYEGWMVEDGYVTEGVTSSAYIIKNDTIITRPLSNSILPGIRRELILEFAPKYDIEVEQRLFTPQEAYEADEAFLSSATTLIYPIIEIDGIPIGDGKPGEMTKRLRELYIEEALTKQWPL